MSKENLNIHNTESAKNHGNPFLRNKKECEGTEKEDIVNEWMKTTGKIRAKIAFEESIILAAKITEDK